MVRAVANPPQAVGGAGKAAEVSPVERSSQPPPVAHSFLINAIGEESLHNISGLVSISFDKSLTRTKMRILSSRMEIAYKLKGNYLKNLLIRAVVSDFKST